MPERPDLTVWVPQLRDALVGRRITGVDVRMPVVVRAQAPISEVLVGRTVQGVARHGGFVAFDVDGAPLRFAVHPMLAGRFVACGPTTKRTADIAVEFALSDGRVLRYRDERQMGKVYAVPPEHPVPGWEPLGLDVLDPGVFTVEQFRRLARTRRDQAKTFLLDHAALDHLGNAYADEALWAAQIHPKARVSKLPDDAIDRLHAAIVGTLTAAIAEIAGRAPPLGEKVRDFLAVRGKKGQPCPRCAAPIRTCGVNGHDAFFCAVCQPDTQQKGFSGWRTGTSTR